MFYFYLLGALSCVENIRRPRLQEILVKLIFQTIRDSLSLFILEIVYNLRFHSFVHFVIHARDLSEKCLILDTLTFSV